MAREIKGLFGEEKTVLVLGRVSSYDAHWPLFVVWILVCAGAGFAWPSWLHQSDPQNYSLQTLHSLLRTRL